MRKLEVDFDELAMAMENHSEIVWHLDLETGEVFPVFPEGMSEESDLDEGRERIEANPEKYIAVPTVDSHEAYNDMAAFAETVKDARLQELLAVALDGRGAFRRFKDVLLDFPQERERWFLFKSERMNERIREWFESKLNLEPIPKKKTL